MESGFEWLSHVNGIFFTLRRSGALVIPFAPSSSYSGFLSSRRLLGGVRCSVLCRHDMVPIVKDYLSEVAQEVRLPAPHPMLPNGWSMFRDISSRVHVQSPAGLEALEVDPNIELIVSGGLRVGRRWSWLAGAPPRIFVSGVKEQDQIKVNGSSVGVSVGGELLSDGVFAEPGEYLVETGSLRRRIQIERPAVSVQFETDVHKSLDGGRDRRIALPQGSWTLIGRSPDQVCYSRGEFFGGTIAGCPFDPIWAVQVGAGPGSVVALVTNPRSPRMSSVGRLTKQTRKLIEQWSSVVYAAHIRRPRFVGLNMGLPPTKISSKCLEDLRHALAKEIKRSLKHSHDELRSPPDMDDPRGRRVVDKVSEEPLPGRLPTERSAIL